MQHGDEKEAMDSMKDSLDTFLGPCRGDTVIALDSLGLAVPSEAELLNQGAMKKTLEHRDTQGRKDHKLR